MSHALMSPSSSHITYKCPASATMMRFAKEREEVLTIFGSTNFIEDEDGPAEEGTRIHAELEAYLKDGIFLSEERYLLELFERFEAFVTPLEWKAIEEKVYLEGTPIFGSPDLSGYVKDKGVITDLKTGRIEVIAKDNSQLMTYGVPLVEKYDHIKSVDLAIVARNFKDTIATYTRKNLLDYKGDVIIPAVKKAYSVNPEKVPGEHCKYCKGNIYCSSFEKMSEEAKKDFDDTKGTLEERYVRSLIFKPHLDSLKKHVKDSLEKGEKFENLELVPHAKTYKYVDAIPEEVKSKLRVEVDMPPKDAAKDKELSKYTYATQSQKIKLVTK